MSAVLRLCVFLTLLFQATSGSNLFKSERETLYELKRLLSKELESRNHANSLRFEEEEEEAGGVESDSCATHTGRVSNGQVMDVITNSSAGCALLECKVGEKSVRYWSQACTGCLLNNRYFAHGAYTHASMADWSKPNGDCYYGQCLDGKVKNGQTSCAVFRDDTSPTCMIDGVTLKEAEAQASDYDGYCQLRVCHDGQLSDVELQVPCFA